MFFQSSESRERHEYIDKSIGNALEVLRTPAVMQRMGDTGIELAQIMENLYPADIRFGIVQPPKRLDNDRIPVVALGTNETLKVDPRLYMQTLKQTEITEELLGHHLATNKRLAEQYAPLRNKPAVDIPSVFAMQRYPQIVAKAIPGTEANVTHTARSLSSLNDVLDGDGAQTFSIEGRPLLTFHKKEQEPYKAPDITVHEATHIYEQMSRVIYPVGSEEYNWRRTLGRELLGYNAQMFCTRGMVESGYVHAPGESVMYMTDETGTGFHINSLAPTVDALRQEANRDQEDPFEPSDRLIAALDKYKLLHVVSCPLPPSLLDKIRREQQ